MPEQTAYDFSSTIQKKIVAMLILEGTTLLANMDIIRPELFDHPALRDIVALLFRFYQKYHRQPSLDEVATEFEELIAVSPRIPEEEYRAVLTAVLEQADGNFDYVRDKVIAFARHQAVRNAIDSASEKMKKHKNYDAVLDDVRSALAIGEAGQDTGRFYFQDLDQRIARRAEGLTRRDLAIGTNIPSLDRVLGGGLAPGELGIIMGPMKRGKTLFSVNMAYGAMCNGIRVLHVIMEGSEDRLSVLYDARISGINKDDVVRRENSEAVKLAVESFYGSPGIERLNTKHYAAQSCSPMAIETHINKLQMIHNFSPELIIVDYLGLMVSNHKAIASSGDRYLMYGQITKELLSLAQRGGHAIWLLHQSTRGSKSKKTVDLEDSADSIEPMRDADLILTLNPVEEEQNLDSGSMTKIRIFVAGGREVADRIGVNVAMDKRYCRIEELPQERRPTTA
jgi:KaiC/GvpD/RAD55 family RecA-like ATPase